jgi:N-acetylglucosaminyl-diphospho-decaprenol L-rhamnosyltransferase
MSPDLAVAVVNHNAGPFLAGCLDSIAASSGEVATEVVLVDNASTDRSVDRATAGHPDVRVIRNPDNRGFARAANQALAATTAPFVLLLNPDAQIVGGKLESLVKVARERPRAGAIGALVRNPDGTIQPSARRVPRLGEALGHAFLGPLWRENPWTRSYTMAGWDRATEREVGWVSGSAMLLRREVIDEVGPFDEGYFMYVEEVDWCYRFKRAGWEVWHCPDALAVHHGGRSTAQRPAAMQAELQRSRRRFYRKHYSPGFRLAAGLIHRTAEVVRSGR